MTRTEAITRVIDYEEELDRKLWDLLQGARDSGEYPQDCTDEFGAPASALIEQAEKHRGLVMHHYFAFRRALEGRPEADD